MSDSRYLADIADRDTTDILIRIIHERRRQKAKHGDQSHLPDGTGDKLSKLQAENRRRECDLAVADGTVTFRHILAEEVAEALAETDPDKLATELDQVAAVCVQWLEAIAKRRR